MDVFSTDWRQEGHPASKTLHHITPHKCTFPPLLFLHRRLFSCLRRTWWDGVKEYVLRGSVKRVWKDVCVHCLSVADSFVASVLRSMMFLVLYIYFFYLVLSCLVILVVMF